RCQGDLQREAGKKSRCSKVRARQPAEHTSGVLLHTHTHVWIHKSPGSPASHTQYSFCFLVLDRGHLQSYVRLAISRFYVSVRRYGRGRRRFGMLFGGKGHAFGYFRLCLSIHRGFEGLFLGGLGISKQGMGTCSIAFGVAEVV